jgi:hypothetical protein
VLLVCVIGGLLARMYESDLRAQWYWATAFLGRGYTDTALRSLQPGDRFADCLDTPSDDQTRHRIRRYCPDMIVVPPARRRGACARFHLPLRIGSGAPRLSRNMAAL